MAATSTSTSNSIQFFDEVSSTFVNLQPDDEETFTASTVLDNSTFANSTDAFGNLLIDPMNEMEINDCMATPNNSKAWSIVCEGILSIIVGLCGLMGNGATIAVLSRPNFKETFHKLLICLSCFDSLFIGSAILIYSIRAYKLYQKGTLLAYLVDYTFMIIYPLANVALYGSIYITLAVSIERFLGVVYPVQSRTRPRRHLWSYLVPVLVLSIGLNIPKALEFQLKATNETRQEAGESEWARDLTYIHYYKVWCNLIVTAIIPITILVICNGIIFFQLRKSRKEMLASRQANNTALATTISTTTTTAAATTTSTGMATSCGNRTQGCNSPDYSLALILAGIVIVFVVCHSCRFFLAFYHVSVVEKTSLCMEKNKPTQLPSWMYVVAPINHLMLMVNSSVNFIIYCAVGSRFRRALTCRLLTRRSHPRPGHNLGEGQATRAQVANANNMNANSQLRTPEAGENLVTVPMLHISYHTDTRSVSPAAGKDTSSPTQLQPTQGDTTVSLVNNNLKQSKCCLQPSGKRRHATMVTGEENVRLFTPSPIKSPRNANSYSFDI